MNKLVTILIAALTITVGAFGQTPPVATFIQGDLNIKYATRTQLDGDAPKEGVEDVYTFNVNVSNSAGFRGTISYLPNVKYVLGNQRGRVRFALELDAINSKNPKQRLNVGKLTGDVPIDDSNVYRYIDGNAKVNVFPVGQAPAFESAFQGLALGKPPSPSGVSALWNKAVARVKGQPVKMTKTVNGKVTELNVVNYDKMELQNHVLPAGPAQSYTEATVNGNFLFDYDRSAWFIDGLKVKHQVKGHTEEDTLTGNIRWSKESSEYQFDIRIDEEPAAEGAVFAGAVGDDAFFAVDTTLRSLTGTIKYRDVLVRGIVTDSAVTLDLKGNNLTKEESIYLSKLILFTMVVPLNAD